LGGTYLTRLTRYLLVALDLKSRGQKEHKSVGVGWFDHVPPTFRTRDLAPVPLHLDFPGEHAISSDGGNGIAV
jgi:hypothetical protein